MSELKIEQSVDQKFSFAGEMTRETIVDAWPEQESTIAQLAGDKLVIDLASVEQVDTAGLAFILAIVKGCKAKNVSLSLKNTPTSLVNLAKLSDVDSILPID